MSTGKTLIQSWIIHHLYTCSRIIHVLAYFAYSSISKLNTFPKFVIMWQYLQVNRHMYSRSTTLLFDWEKIYIIKWIPQQMLIPGIQSHGVWMAVIWDRRLSREGTWQWFLSGTWSWWPLSLGTTPGQEVSATNRPKLGC